MKYLLAAIAAAVVSINPVAAAPETPLGFLFQSLDPRNYVMPPAPPAPWNLSQAQAPRAQPAPSRQYGVYGQRYAPVGFPGLRYPSYGRGYDANRQVVPAARTPSHGNEVYLKRTIVPAPYNYEPGTVVIDTNDRFLYLMMENGQALRYGVGVGRQGFEWSGEASIGRKAEWPDWVPPAEMREREPWLPERMQGGDPENPLGARALYLFEGNKDTLYRIHGTNQPETIGQAVSSGCIRLQNEDVVDLYQRVPVGAKVVVL